ncbi:peptidyl-tRNA hydrolase [Gemmata sp. SH-PL17]|uniref:peptidyl-tRNA hydrolase n=1 Tax=Gemmata sp. SH-PL17 TaxID=1630693 RepID=UPI0012FADDE0|nr:peptidyl-tRNA hydrolase [Gemmata sp. SH-PL17]
MPKAATSKAAYVYVVTRLDIPHPHFSVQIAHAAIAATFAFGEPDSTHPNLVVCAVANEQELDALFNRLKEKGVRCCAWHEEDMGKKLTAIATAPLRGDERKPLKRLKLIQAP